MPLVTIPHRITHLPFYSSSFRIPYSIPTQFVLKLSLNLLLQIKPRHVLEQLPAVNFVINPLTPNDLQRRRAVSPLKIKIPVKICVQNQQMQQLFIQFINYVW
jgi:hypothetical protein